MLSVARIARAFCTRQVCINVYRTHVHWERGLISILAPDEMFTSTKYLCNSLTLSENDCEPTRCLYCQLVQIAAESESYHYKHAKNRVQCCVPSILWTSYSGHIRNYSTMGVGCLVNRRRSSVTRNGPSRRFSITSSLDTINLNATSQSLELVAFDKLFTQVVEDLTEMFPQQELNTIMNWFRKVLQYNVPHGKKNRGIAVVESYKHLVPNAGSKEMDMARILGWCVELDGVGDIAINDSYFVNACLYQLLRKYFHQEPYYCNLVDLFHEVDMRTVIGQGLDLLTAPTNGTVDLNAFSVQRYDTIVTWKTAYYSFYLPVALALHMAGINDQKSHEQASNILLKMGHFYQVQDDYLDCYGDPAITGKIGSDIEENKCSWLINRALVLCDRRQRQILEENYGRNDPYMVLKVKEIFKELDMEKEYIEFERTSYEDLMKMIENSHSKLPKKMFSDFVDKIYKRIK